MRSILAITALAMLSGCAQKLSAASEAGIAEKKAVNDVQAETFLQAPCDVAIGALIRRNNPEEFEAVWTLCKQPGSEEPEIDLPEPISAP